MNDGVSDDIIATMQVAEAAIVAALKELPTDHHRWRVMRAVYMLVLGGDIDDKNQ